MTMFQKMCQLIAVLGMHNQLYGVRRFLLRLDRPAFCISSRIGRSILLYFLADRRPGFLDRFFHIIRRKVSIFFQTFHNGGCQLVGSDSVTCHITASLSGILPLWISA
uniref:Uncharacterized protein n=1 Tax=Siphoviridae sp. ctquf9 TaxID=2826470 RepID=A0A8S5M4J3_9CAUD|nr:MAG TPA: hypothetical protein [Siphoviridae sp. ctquf9]